jgi:hypothetical protein
VARFPIIPCLVLLVAVMFGRGAVAQRPDSPGTATPGTESNDANSPGTNTPGANAPGANAPGANTPAANTPAANAPGASSPAAATNPSLAPGVTETPAPAAPQGDGAAPAAPGAGDPATAAIGSVPPPPAAVQTAPPPPAETPAPPVVAAEQVAPTELTGLLGHAVVGPGGATIGQITDLLIDRQGRVRGVVVDVGGFMGVGNRKVAVAWSALRFDSGPKGPVISVVIPPDRIKSWADYIAGRPVAILGAAGSPP